MRLVIFLFRSFDEVTTGRKVAAIAATGKIFLEEPPLKNARASMLELKVDEIGDKILLGIGYPEINGAIFPVVTTIDDLSIIPLETEETLEVEITQGKDSFTKLKMSIVGEFEFENYKTLFFE